MGKIYLKKVKAIQRNRCLGCYFFNEFQSFFDINKFTCNETYKKECHKGFIFKQEFKSAPKISNKTMMEVIEDREISYSHKTYDGPGAQSCQHNLPMGATTGMSGYAVDPVCGMPRTGNGVNSCGTCGNINDFKEVYLICNIPFKREILAYACNRCGIVRMKV